ncbi:hypothetical protein DFH09DRAFT_1077652 [Mycena vulgaris]|nr:hypothetical protein DFH09DRAFT_1077652 [Mycena vulgaris]
MFAICIASLLLATSFVSASHAPLATRPSTADVDKRSRRHPDQSNDFDVEMQDVTNALDGLLSTASTIPALGGLLAGVDVAPPGLTGLEILFAGVLNLVATLIKPVSSPRTMLFHYLANIFRGNLRRVNTREVAHQPFEPSDGSFAVHR